MFSIVLECIETSLAKEISKNLEIPTIGIGSSKFCDGQVLVTDDLIGLNQTKIRFVKKFGNVNRYKKFHIKKSVLKFKKEVLNIKNFPNQKNTLIKNTF